MKQINTRYRAWQEFALKSEVNDLLTIIFAQFNKKNLLFSPSYALIVLPPFPSCHYNHRFSYCFNMVCIYFSHPINVSLWIYGFSLFLFSPLCKPSSSAHSTPEKNHQVQLTTISIWLWGLSTCWFCFGFTVFESLIALLCSSLSVYPQSECSKFLLGSRCCWSQPSYCRAKAGNTLNRSSGPHIHPMTV